MFATDADASHLAMRRRISSPSLCLDPGLKSDYADHIFLLGKEGAAGGTLDHALTRKHVARVYQLRSNRPTR